MAVLTIAAIVGGVTALAGTGYALSGAGQPQQPNLASSSAQMSKVQAQLLPYLRQLQAASEKGGQALRYGYKQTTDSGAIKDKLQRQLNQAQAALKQAQNAVAGQGKGVSRPNLTSAVTAAQARVDNLQSQIQGIQDSGGTVYLDKNGKVVPASQALVDFSGYSQADVQGKIMQEMAQSQLELSQKYDPQFIASALEQEKLADPQSFEARQQLYDLIQKQVQNPPKSPVADEMQRQVQERVDAGSKLTPDEEAMFNLALDQGGRDRGQGTTPGAQWDENLTTGFGGEQRAMSNAGAGEAFLASGQTPEDILYRAERQNLSNLGSFVNNQTPQAQFRELSGAQAGPTPVTTGGAAGLPTLNPNAGQLGASAAVTGYQQQIEAALNQPNPWMTGLTGVLGAASAAGKAGYKPFGTN